MNIHSKSGTTLRKLIKRSLPIAITAALTVSASSINAQPLPTPVDAFQQKTRIFVLTDMGNEPDDQMSMVRLLTYANELDIEGLVATTSTWKRTEPETKNINAIIDSYKQVRPNLLKNADGWPTAQALSAVVATGQPSYGMADVGKGHMTPGAKALIAAVDKQDQRPLWVTLWGGANTLAQALYHVRETRSASELKAFEQKLRVYSISDQDDAGPWIRQHFPDVMYIVKPSSADSGSYASATWTGIAGDEYYKNAAGADFTKVSNEWLEKNIRSKGPMGKHYLRYAFIMEGDTPSYLGLIPNGLNSYRSPSWGGWGGRYIYRQPYAESHPIWTQGGDWFNRVTSADTVIGVDGKSYTSDQATIWRWRDQFQNDFAARMSWTVSDYEDANHYPVIDVNGQQGKQAMVIHAKPGDQITLDASATTDPDKDKLHYHWFHYREAGFSGVAGHPGLADITVNKANSAKTVVTVNKACRPGWIKEQTAACKQGGEAHVILEVTDNGQPALTSYRRVVIKVNN